MLTRRKFIESSTLYCTYIAISSELPFDSKIKWSERRDIYPQGVASGDPQFDSVILWTRRPPSQSSRTVESLTVEVAEDASFKKVIAVSNARISSNTDWTCRVLVTKLKPGTEYWYRFTDKAGNGSRIGRTITAPDVNDERPIHFAFVSCQNLQEGSTAAYRKMIWEDEQKQLKDQLDFVLHLGDFVYEVVQYPDEKPTRYSRKIRDVVRYKNGEKIRDFYIPNTLEDYCALYAAYLTDPGLQDARARWPFVCMWDNHEFSWRGWQSQQVFDKARPAQKVKVIANQAWFNYQPARVKPQNVNATAGTLNEFPPLIVTNEPLNKFDENGLGIEPNNLAAINSLIGYRSLRFGKSVELIITDNHSFRSKPSDTDKFQHRNFPWVMPEEILEIVDAGRKYNDNKPPETIKFNNQDIPNPGRNEHPQSILGVEQKKWFLSKLSESSAPWKLWGNSNGMLEMRIDFQNLPEEIKLKWLGNSYATMGDGDWSGCTYERRELLDHIRSKGITGVISIAGDRHSFQAGLVTRSLPPHKYDPVIPEFVTGSISAPGLAEAAEYSISKDHPLRFAYYQSSPEAPIKPAINVSLMHGIRSSLALQKTGSVDEARKVRNPELAPHLSFMDVGGHGYAVVHAMNDVLNVEFVCIPRPIEDDKTKDGGPLAYRALFKVKQWKKGETPSVERTDVNFNGALPLIL